MKRYMHIFPTFEQAEMDPENFIGESAFANYMKPLGIADDSIFGNNKEGKRFKIRLTSKKTGKKIDVNMSFATRRSKEEQPEIVFDPPKKAPTVSEYEAAATEEWQEESKTTSGGTAEGAGSGGAETSGGNMGPPGEGGGGGYG